MKRITNFIRHPLFSGSAVMIVGSNLANFIAYIYHLIIGRILGPSLYSELAAVISLEAFISSLFLFMGIVVVKFVSSAKEKELDPILSWFTKKALVLSLVVSLLLFILTPIISKFLHIESKIIILVGPISFLFLISFVLRSFLQGLVRFGRFVIVTNIEFLTRLIFGLLFLYFGLKIFGVVLGIFLAAFAGLFLSFYFIKDRKILGESSSFKESRKVFTYTLPVFLSAIATNSFLTTDILLVKHFFDPTAAGLYASISTLGKIIFYGSAPVGAVMFPIVAKKYSLGQNYKKIFLLSLFLTSLLVGLVLLIYFLFPKLSITILYGDEYLGGVPYLFWSGLFFALYSLAILFISFYLSIGKTKIVILPALFSIVQVVGILKYHDSLTDVLRVSIVASFLLLISLLIYFGYEKEKKNKRWIFF